jgi:ribosome-associated heat shock protein Hsp15
LTDRRRETDEAPARLDRWLWFARFFKSRTLATAFCETGRIRVNGIPAAKAHHPVRPGDVLTFALASRVRIVRVMALANRRGPASEARLLYEDLTRPDSPPSGHREEPGSPPG